MSVPLTNIYRGAHRESSHRGSIAVVDMTGRLVAFAHGNHDRGGGQPLEHGYV